MQSSINAPSLKVYRSSAGSGKTFTLVKEYLKIVFASKKTNAFKEILAITFTNRAANEMKERIVDALYKLSKGDEELLKIYGLELGLKKNEIQETSCKILSKILHQYSDFSVFTIDKFTHRLIRSFSQELGLSFNFNVELNEKDFLNESVSRLLELIGKDKALTKYLYQFVDQSLGDSSKSNIEKQLSEFQQLIFKGNRDDKLIDFEHLTIPYFSSIRSDLYNELIDLDEKNVKLAKECYDLMKDHGVDVDCFYQKSKRFPKIYDLLRKKDAFDIKDVEKWEQWLIEERWIAGKLEPSKVIKIEAILPDLIKSTNLIIQNSKKVLFLREVLKLFTAYSLINQLVNQIEISKKEKSILLISDFNRLIGQIIKNEPASFIFERIGTRYKHFLFDEFQDTSVRQWSNLVPLVHESLSKGGVNLLVGDAKQAIYRWREGDVDQFLDLPNVDQSMPFSDDINHLFETYFFADELKVNRRSLPEVVDFNNWLFSGLKSKIALRKIQEAYKGHVQEIHRSEAGYVECLICTKKEDHINFKLNYLLDIISRCLSNGYSYKDIAVVVRKNKEGTHVAQFLQDQNIPVISGESIVLNSSNEVQMIVDAIKSLEFDNEQSKVKLIQALGVENLTNVYFDYLIDKKKTYNRKIDIKRFLNDKFLDFDLMKYRSLGIVEKVYHIISAFKINRFSAYVDQFLDLLFDFIHKNGATLKGFITHYDNEAERTAVDVGSQDAIHVITIHKSKGLQFPIVLMPFASWPDKERSNTDLIWINSDQMKNSGVNSFIANNNEQSLKRLNKHHLYLNEKEQLIFANLNMYYVAFTRAQDRLYMCLGPSPKNVVNPNVKDLIIEEILAHKSYDSDINILSIGEEKQVNRKPAYSDLVTDFCPEIKSNKYDLALSLDKNKASSSYSSQQIFGILLHEVLEKVKYDFQTALEHIMLLKKQSKIDSSLEDKLNQSVFALQNERALDLVYSREYNVYNEVEISSKDGDMARIDRLLINNNKIIIVDYKTGMPKEKDNQQIRKYASLIEEIGFDLEHCFLIYLPELKIEHLVL